MSRVLELQAAFDQAFAEPLDTTRPVTQDLLLVQAGQRAVALPSDRVAHVAPCLGVTALPGARTGCLGVALARGRPIAVYDLATLLGAGATDAAWLVLCRDAPIALAVSAVHGQHRLPVDSPRDATGDPQTPFLLNLAGTRRPLVDLRQIVAAVLE